MINISCIITQKCTTWNKLTNISNLNMLLKGWSNSQSALWPKWFILKQVIHSYVVTDLTMLQLCWFGYFIVISRFLAYTMHHLKTKIGQDFSSRAHILLTVVGRWSTKTKISNTWIVYLYIWEGGIHLFKLVICNFPGISGFLENTT
jgi:hypothetical protein